MAEKKRRTIALLIVLMLSLGATLLSDLKSRQEPADQVAGTNVVEQQPKTQKASEALEELEVKGRAPKTGYSRSEFGQGWAQLDACDVRNYVLKRDLTSVQTRSDTDCTVISGILNDPYTGKQQAFIRGPDTSDDVQIDHVVALSDAWQKGAQNLEKERRVQFANDGLNLLAFNGTANNQKSDSDAASWLPPDKAYRCMYVARQIAVKQKYVLWVTAAEKDAMGRVLASCPDQQLPYVGTVL